MIIYSWGVLGQVLLYPKAFSKQIKAIKTKNVKKNSCVKFIYLYYFNITYMCVFFFILLFLGFGRDFFAFKRYSLRRKYNSNFGSNPLMKHRIRSKNQRFGTTQRLLCDCLCVCLCISTFP